MKKYLTKKYLFVGSAILIATLIVLYFVFRDKTPKYATVEAKRENLTQEVSVTGKVKPSENVDLALEVSGKVVWKNADVGSVVKAGQVLLQINNAEAKARVEEAEAQLKNQQAKLDELNRGARPEEIQIYETKLLNAQNSLQDAENNLDDKIKDAYLKADDSVRNKADKFFNNPRTTGADLNLTTNDFQLKIDVNSGRVLLESVLNSWDGNSAVNSITAKNNLYQISVFLDKLAMIINALTPSGSLTQTTIDSYKSDIFTARTNINAATANLITADEKFKTASTALSLAEKELILKRAGATPEQIASQEAMVQQAVSNVNNLKAQLAKTFIVAPISGTVTAMNAKTGEIVSAGKNIVSIISGNKFKIETDAPEADISKINAGENASVTLDAYGDDEKFDAVVAKIDPAETVIEGVSTYKVTLEFKNEDARIRSGMTANIDITTGTRNNVITVPQRTVTEKGGLKTVEVLVGKNVEVKTIKTGMRGNNGNIEITEGLNEGDKVIISASGGK